MIQCDECYYNIFGCPCNRFYGGIQCICSQIKNDNEYELVEINLDEDFYPAIGPYRSFYSDPKYICKDYNGDRISFKSYEDACAYIRIKSIPEDGRDVFIKRNCKWYRTCRNNETKEVIAYRMC